MDAIARHVATLGARLLAGLVSLRHPDGGPVVRIYGPDSWDRRGATVALNFLHPDGRVVDERHVEALAATHRISLRTGCFCNPGAGEAAFGVSPAALAAAGPGDDLTLDELIARIGMPSGGAVRISLGLATNDADVDRFLSFAAGFADLDDVPRDLPARVAC